MAELWEELNEGSAEIDRQVGEMEEQDGAYDWTPMHAALRDVGLERFRQEGLRVAGKFAHTCADATAMIDTERFAVLGEEFGEVAREVVEHGDDRELRKELVQVAAVAVAWIEAIDATRAGGAL